jgi:hypothetical protein
VHKSCNKDDDDDDHGNDDYDDNNDDNNNNLIFSLSLALQPSAGYGLLVHEVS